MRKLIHLTLIVLIANTVSAQIPDYTLGLRFGGTVNAYGAEVSYQIGVSDKTRLELDLGYGSLDGLSVIKAVGGFHWSNYLASDFYWYGGPVLAAGMFRQEKDNKENEEFKSFIHIGAVLGVEYFFNQVPLQVSLDFRPEFPIGDSYTGGDFDNGFGLGVRYILEW